MADQELNRSEEATPFRRQEALKKGSVAKSLEMISFLMLLAVVGVLYFQGNRLVQGSAGLGAALLSNAHLLAFNLPDLINWISGAIRASLLLLVPVLVILAAVGVFANLVQTGPVFSMHPLKPDF